MTLMDGAAFRPRRSEIAKLRAEEEEPLGSVRRPGGESFWLLAAPSTLQCTGTCKEEKEGLPHRSAFISNKQPHFFHHVADAYRIRLDSAASGVS